MRKILLGILGLFVFGFVMVLGFVFVLVFTPSPVKWTLDSLNKPAEGSMVSYDSIEGNALKGYAFKNLRMESPKYKISFPSLNLQYDLAKTRSQGTLVISDVSCLDCDIDLMDPAAMIRKKSRNSAAEDSKARAKSSDPAEEARPEKKSKLDAVLIEKFHVSNFHFKADFSKMPEDKKALVKSIPSEFTVKEVLLEKLDLQNTRDSGYVYLTLGKMLLNTPWLSANVENLSVNPKTNEYSWTGDLSVTVEALMSPSLVQKPFEIKANIGTNEKQEKEYRIAGFGGHVTVNLPMKLEGGQVIVDGFNPREYLKIAAPLKNVSFIHALEGKPAAWGTNLLKDVSFSLANENYKVVEFNDKEKWLRLKDESGINQIAVPATMSFWPPAQVVILKSAYPNAKTLFEAGFPEQNVPEIAGQSVDYPSLLKNGGLVVSPESVFTAPVKIPQRRPASMGRPIPLRKHAKRK